MIDKSEILNSSQIKFITLVYAGAQCCGAFFPGTENYANMLTQNQFF
jgi:hypothetical protein